MTAYPKYDRALSLGNTEISLCERIDSINRNTIYLPRSLIDMESSREHFLVEVRNGFDKHEALLRDHLEVTRTCPKKSAAFRKYTSATAHIVVHGSQSTDMPCNQFRKRGIFIFS